MIEDYVNFETAKLLKEKGFNEYCRAFRSPSSRGAKGLFYSVSEIKNTEEKKTLGAAIACPTLQMAMKWLREVHNIDIDIHAEAGMLGTKVYIPMVSTYKTSEADSEKLKQYKRGIYHKDDNGIIPALQYYHTYEEACESAIKYCLENLI